MTITLVSLTNYLTCTSNPNITIQGHKYVFQGVTRESGDGKCFNVHVIDSVGLMRSFFMRLAQDNKFE